LGGYFSDVLERDLKRGIAHHEAALRALGERAALEPSNALAQRNYGDQFVMKATAHNTMKDGAGALDATNRALAVLRPLADADPRNKEAQHDLMFAYGERGIALMHLRRWKESEESLQQAVAILERLRAGDPSNKEVLRDLDRLGRQLGHVRRRMP
ncbi:MAG: hypothetical protein ACLGH0_00850, partial [Thermoanaerobaculia bacterium]